MSGHERERLSAYLDGELAPTERAGVEAHLAACPECTAFLADLAAVDEAAAALPAEAPQGYFDTFPARVRARLQPRKAALPARRVPAWTWAVAAALALAVITPLTLRHGRPGASEARLSASGAQPAANVAPSPAAKAATMRDEPSLAAPPPAPRPTQAPPMAAQTRPAAPAALPHVEEEPRPALREARDRASDGAFASEPRPAPQEKLARSRRDVTAAAESEGAPAGVVGGVVSQDAAKREKVDEMAPRAAITAAAASSMASDASAGHEATPASLKAQEDAFLRLEAARPRTAAGWHRVRQQWKSLAAAEADPVRADEERVRAVVAAREAWRAEGEPADEAAFRAEAESYLRRDDARQKPRVEGLLAEAARRRP